ncbi:MAG TPA: hypothetical protein VH765_03820 [Xanthobacteraceae bacterium]|jgi:hypothetical protein
MKRALIAMCAAAAIATAGTLAVPTKAEAHVWWWIPAAIVGGVVLGAAIAGPRAYAAPRGYYEPTAARGEVYGEPRGAVAKRPVRARN